MTLTGQILDALDTPQALIDLNIVDANARHLFSIATERGVDVRVHFKSLKCTGLAKYLTKLGAKGFLCAKLSEAEILADAGLTDILIANQIVGPLKMKRLAALAKRAQLRVCVDNVENADELSKAMQPSGAELGVLVEVDVGMGRCGVEPGDSALNLARKIDVLPGLRFDGLQGYDGHMQLTQDVEERRKGSNRATEKLVATRRLIEKAGLPVRIVTGAGTGTWEFVSQHEGVTEVQPGSFVLMDAAYHAIRPEFGCSLSLLTTVISKRAGQYVLDAGSKAISRDFGTPVIKNHPEDRAAKLAEEHCIVESTDNSVKIGDRREVLPTHCCATMNLHRQCIAVRDGIIEAVWPIEASGRYD